MPLTSKSKLYRTLPSCFADQVSSLNVKRQNDTSTIILPTTVDNRGLIVSGESRRPLGRPPCGPRRVRRNNVPLRPTAGSNGEQLKSTNRSDTPQTPTHQNYPDTKPVDNPGEEWPAANVLPSVMNFANDRSQSAFHTSPSSSPSSKTSSTLLPPVIDENLVHLLNSYNIRGDSGSSRPSSAGSSNSGRKRASTQSQAAVRSGGISGSSTLPRRSPRTALSLDTVDLWDDSNSDLSGSSASTAAVASSAVRRTVDLGRSSPAEAASTSSTSDRFRAGNVVRGAYGATSFAPSRKLSRIHRRTNDKDDGTDRHSGRLLQQQWQQRHFRHEKTSQLASGKSSANGNNIVRRTLNDATSMMYTGKIPQLVESTGRPSTAARRPTTAADASTAAVRLNFHDLQLYIRGLRMFAETPTSVADEDNGIAQSASVVARFDG